MTARERDRAAAKPRGQAGFTLVEVMLALGLAGMLFAAMFVSLHQVIESRNEMANRSTPYTVGPAILDVIAADLANAYFYEFVDNNVFYGADAQLLARDADALSFIALSKAHLPDGDFDPPPMSLSQWGRYSHANEVSYVCRTGRSGTGFLELWRREDFFVDEAPHSDGDYVLLYDKIHSINFRYVSRDSQSAEGVGGSERKSQEEMLQDGWSSIDEKGVPRAVQVELTIFAQDSDDDVWDAVKDGAARLYTFSRYLPLPQVHMSRTTELEIAEWDGEFNEATAVTARNPSATANAAAGQGGAGGQGRGGAGAGGRVRGNQARGRGRGNQGGRPPAGAAGNPFLQALQGRGRGGGGRPSGGAGGLSGLFGGGR